MWVVKGWGCRFRRAPPAGLDQNRGRPAVDKLLMRRNSGSGLRELDLINWPSGLASIKSVAGRLLINCLCGAIAGRASES